MFYNLQCYVNGLFSCLEEANRQLVAEGALESVVALTSHADSSDVANAAASLLLSITSHAPSLRQYLGRAGAIEYFICHLEELYTSDETSLHKYRIIDAICQCCRDANNRVRIREQGGLSLLTNLLSDSKLTNIHDRIISAFICFIYDDASIAVLLQSLLVPTLVSHLYRVAGITKKPDFIGLDSLDVCESDLTETVDADPKGLDNAYICCDDLKGASDQQTNFEVKETDDLLSHDSSGTAVLGPLSAVGTSVLQTGQLIADKNQSTVEFDLLPAADESVVSEPDNVDVCARTPRYSINSPTYKAVSAWRMALTADEDEDDAHDRHGPRNIWEGARLYAETFSAVLPSFSGSVSPTRSLGSCSDGLCSVQSWSSSLCDSSPQKSPGVSPAWSVDLSAGGMYSPFSNSSYGYLDGACSPSSFSDPGDAQPSLLSRYDDELEAAAESCVFSVTEECSKSTVSVHSDENMVIAELPAFVTDVSDVGQQNDNVGSSSEFSSSVDIVDGDENGGNASRGQNKSEDATKEEFGEQCSDDEFDAESFQRKRRDERRFLRLLDIAKSMYASIETKPVLQSQQTKKRRRSSSSNTSPSVSRRHKFQCLNVTPKTEIMSDITGANDSGASLAKDLQNSSRTIDSDSCAVAAKCLQAADDNNSSEISSDAESKASDDTSTCSVHRRSISQVTERNILTLLSRISHSPETVAHMMNASTICGLLDYALLARIYLPSASRTLLRLSRSHHGFQRAVLCLFPVQVVWRTEPDFFVCGKLSSPHSDKSNDSRYFCQCISCSRRSAVCVDIDSADSRAAAEAAQNNCSEMTEIIFKSKKSNRIYSSLNAPIDNNSIGLAETEQTQECVTLKLCDEIISNLSTIAISGYGQGVISHLLLRGSDHQRERCVISLCFLCRFVFYVTFHLIDNRWSSN